MLRPVLAEKCPNCGAFLPVRQAGVAVRQCAYCDLQLPGSPIVVDVPRLTVPRQAVVLPPSSRRGVIAVVIPLAAVVIVVIAIATVATRDKGAAQATTASKEPEPVAAPAPPQPGPLDEPEAIALREAIARAGGEASVDLAVLGAFADERVRAVAPDAVLLTINCSYVRSDGKADLALQPDARCSWDYRAPSRVERPEGTPVGVEVSVPCNLSFSAGAGNMYGDVNEHRDSLDDCRRRSAMKPPRCTPQQIWERAIAAGAPADAVAQLHLGARYRSPYDPIEPGDDPDRPERGVWRLDIARDGADDFRHESADDCGQPPPTDDERAVLKEIKKHTVALTRCAARAAGKHASVEALEMIWRLAADGGRTRVAFADPGVDIEGMFQGDLDAIRASWSDCASAIATKLKVPAALGEIRLVLRVTPGGTLELQPPPFD